MLKLRYSYYTCSVDTMGSHGNEIQRLADDSIRRIVAEQAITDLSSIVKELVDNALDAESTTIKSTLTSRHSVFVGYLVGWLVG